MNKLPIEIKMYIIDFLPIEKRSKLYKLFYKVVPVYHYKNVFRLVLDDIIIVKKFQELSALKIYCSKDDYHYEDYCICMNCYLFRKFNDLEYRIIIKKIFIDISEDTIQNHIDCYKSKLFKDLCEKIKCY